MVRILLTSICLTLLSHSAWSTRPEWPLVREIDCDRIKHFSDEAFANIDTARKEIWDLTGKIIEKQNGKFTAEQNKTKTNLESLISDALDDLEKWATIYKAFCK